MTERASSYEAKCRAHQALDALWKLGLIDRHAAYALIAAHFGRSGVHISDLSLLECEELIVFCRNFREAYALNKKKHPGGVEGGAASPVKATIGQRIAAKGR